MLTRRATLALMYVLTLIVAGSAGPIPYADAALAQSPPLQVPFSDQGAELAVHYNTIA